MSAGLAVAALVSLGLVGGDVADRPFEPCDGATAPAWVTDFRDRMLAYDGFVQFAREERGDPIACDGEIDSEFDGALFGSLVLTFGGGLSVEARTSPPESSVTVLRADAGFDAPDVVTEMLRTHAAARGLRIDWAGAPEVTEEDGERVERYWDPDTGLNAAAFLVFRGDQLVAVGVSVAL